MNEQPHPTRVRLLPWRIPDWVIDAILLTVLAVVSLVRTLTNDDGLDAAEWISAAVAIPLILARRRYPVPTLVATVVAAAIAVAVTDEPTVLLPVALAALFNVAQQSERKTTILAGAATIGSFLLIITVILGDVPFGGAGLASIAWPAFAATAGIVIRSTRESVSSAEDRAARAEESRELDSQRRVVEERLRIARDVHDLVAHHIAVINVQSAVAGHLMESDPSAAGEALGVVRSAASTVVDQLGELLSVLRSPDEVDELTTPTPDLAAVQDLISSFAASGLAIRTETSGVPRHLSGVAELAAYRVVQEALTNAHKHGDGTAAVSLRFDDGGLRITVTNPSSGSVPQGKSDGFGLVGMRERVEATGGALWAGPIDEGQHFQIVATIPSKDNT